MFVYSTESARAQSRGRGTQVHVSNLTLPWVTSLQKSHLVYRTPIVVRQFDGHLSAGPVYAILAGNDHFTGSRSNFRDIIQMASRQNTFVYVLPPQSVGPARSWTGYVRIGQQRWISIPCPHPEVVYNRIPNRALERTNEALTAKKVFATRKIPFFNPNYFNKADIYQVIRQAGLSQYLPDTLDGLTRSGFEQLLQRHHSVYLKPSGGSVGHGIIRVDSEGRGWQVHVIKEKVGHTFNTQSLTQVWNLVQRHRLPGPYVVQATVQRITWNGHPCDLRILAQKSKGDWKVVGKGVRAAGVSGVTTHVPNGGSIAPLRKVLEASFANDADSVDSRVDEMILQCASAIDKRHSGLLGEMSFDVGLDEQGGIWFFEANAKPMKFDEPDIRQKSLIGVLEHMKDLRQHPLIR